MQALFDLAHHSHGQPVPLHVIAERQKLSLPFLEQIFNKLKKAGVVASVRGPKGGWRDAGHPVSTTKGAFAGLYRLAARAAGEPDGWRALRDSGQALLQGLADELTPDAELRLAMEALWHGVAPLRRARAASGDWRSTQMPGCAGGAA